MPDPDPGFEFFDAHVHYWVPANRWYGEHGRYPSLPHSYLPSDYAAETGDCTVRGVVHVSAAGTGSEVAEAGWLRGFADDDCGPRALIGGADAAEGQVRVLQTLDAQAEDSLYRGARVAALDPGLEWTTDILRVFGDRGWILEINPTDLGVWVDVVRRAAATAVVLEHCGRPTSEDSAYFDAWRRAMGEIAGAENVTCKLSSLPMRFSTTDPARLGPWIDACIDLFGVDRCFFATNFPFDRMYGSFTELMASYRTAVRSFSATEQRALFVDNAERTYGV